MAVYTKINQKEINIINSGNENLIKYQAQKMMEQQLQTYYQECMSQLQNEASKIENQVVSEKEFKFLTKQEEFAQNIVDSVQFYSTRVKQT